MKDAKLKSLVESVFNLLVGIIIAFITNMVVLPLFGMPFSLTSFGWISLIYTFISLVRSYLIRRMFVHGFYEDVFRRVMR
jgi:hypothetical protein